MFFTEYFAYELFRYSFVNLKSTTVPEEINFCKKLSNLFAVFKLTETITWAQKARIYVFYVTLNILISNFQIKNAFCILIAIQNSFEYFKQIWMYYKYDCVD